MEIDNEKLKQLINEKGLRRKWVAEHVGISKRTLDNYCNGSYRSPRVPTIKQLAQVLGVHESRFMRVSAS